MVTIKQIAKICGVSRGTVDRVLNNRGNVRPEKASLILDMAKKLNYTPSPSGRALVSRKRKPTVGILMPSEGIKFFDDVIRAMKQAEEKYRLFGLNVIWRIMSGYDVKAQCQAFDELKSSVNALIVNPINDPLVLEKINQYTADGIFVVAVNNDIEGADTLQYVGSDYFDGGRTAAALLRMIRPEGGDIGVVLGSMHILGHKRRLEGFRSVLEGNQRFQIVAVEEDGDDDSRAFERTTAMLRDRPNINALFLASSGGASGACKAVMDAGREKDLTVIAFDTIPAIVDMMRKGVVDAAIYQHPRQQGQRSMQIVFDYLINGIKPDHNLHIMKNDIRISLNV